MNNNNDLELIKATLRGDRGSFAAMVEKYKDMVFNLAYRMTGKLADAEDLTQEIFLKVYRKLSKFDLSREFGPWIYTVSVNACNTYFRRKRYLVISLSQPKQLEDGEIYPEIGSDAENPERELAKKDGQARVQKIISSLPVRFRAIFILRYIENKQYREIAEIANLPLGTVKTYLFRGQKLLAEKLKE